jgi:hypothetical protein
MCCCFVARLLPLENPDGNRDGMLDRIGSPSRRTNEKAFSNRSGCRLVVRRLV